MCWLFERKQHIIYYFSETLLRGGRNRRDRKAGTEGEWREGEAFEKGKGLRREQGLGADVKRRGRVRKMGEGELDFRK